MSNPSTQEPVQAPVRAGEAAGKHRLVLAGGGTGGHVMAGLAVADEWCKRFGAEARVMFIGARGGIEEKVLPRTNYPLRLLRLGSLNRVSLGRKLRTAIQLPLSFVHSAALLIAMRPKVVIGVGGYASGPVVLMARLIGWLWGARTAIIEQNSVPGLTNRILGRLVHRVFTCFDVTKGHFPPGRAAVTGNPTRSTMTALPPAPRDPFTVFIFGGSQGALGMNTLVIEALPHLRDLQGRVRFIHQTGERDYERVARAHEEAGTGARVEKFIHDMLSCYREASLVICRAGASTLSEIAAVRRAAFLVPLPTAADNHQEKNARVLVDAGAARLVPQQETSGLQLAKMIREMVEAPSLVEQMEQRVGDFSRPRAAEDIVSTLVP